MKINYSGDNEIVLKAVEKANFVLENNDFHTELAAAQNIFDHSNVNGAVVSNLIKNTQIKATVEIYTSIWRWSRVNGYTIDNGENKIFLNSRKLNEAANELNVAATLVHEFLHLVDFENDNFFFGHDGNRSAGNDNTAPYWIDTLTEKILNQEI